MEGRTTDGQKTTMTKGQP